MNPAHSKLFLLYAGIHPQEDRDARLAVKAARQAKKNWNMIRVRLPLGALTVKQYLALDDLAERVTYNRSLRLTAGQSVQLHGVPDSELDSCIKELEIAGLAVGAHPEGFEVAVAVPPMPLQTTPYRLLRGLAGEIRNEYYPKPGGGTAAHPNHPPRKFTIGFGLPEDNSANIFAHDLSFLLTAQPEFGWRLNVLAGGGLSMPARRPDLYARLASPLGSVVPDRLIPVVRAVTSVFSTHGKLATRRYTRLKYVVEALGLDAFRAAVEQELGQRFDPLIPYGGLAIPTFGHPRDQGNGLFLYPIVVPFGRIQDAGRHRYKAAIRLIVEAFGPKVIVTPDQNIILSDLQPGLVQAVEQILAAYHLQVAGSLSPLRSRAMACAGLPTCPLAVAESERVAGGILNDLEAELASMGRAGAEFSFRISGCSIGCIRPNMVDLGAVGRKPGHYDLFIGGNEAVGRFGTLYAENVPLQEIISTMRPVLRYWGENGRPDEPFSDFFTRLFHQGSETGRLALSDLAPLRDHFERVMRQGAHPCSQ